jgi:L-ascorbate metabolism protein UlaG (beta-lactamase superfamily)
MDSYTIDGVVIEWLGHDSFRIQGQGIVIYTDPYKLASPRPPADIVLVTHEHFDHCSPSDIGQVLKEGTVVVAPRIALDCVARARAPRILEAEAWSTLEVKGARITPVPAYNVNKFRSPGVVFHPKEDGRVGYIVELGGTKIYHAGDTDLIPETRRLGEMGIDVALLPVSGVYVMTPEEAAEAARIIRPRVAIPMHYGSIVASKREAERFKKLLEGEVEVVILERRS